MVRPSASVAGGGGGGRERDGDGGGGPSPVPAAVVPCSLHQHPRRRPRHRQGQRRRRSAFPALGVTVSVLFFVLQLLLLSATDAFQSRSRATIAPAPLTVTTLRRQQRQPRGGRQQPQQQQRRQPPWTTTTASTADGTAAPLEDRVERAHDVEEERADVVICGGGPAGLLSAVAMARKFRQQRQQEPADRASDTSQPPRARRRIRVYDRLREPPDADDVELWNTDVAKYYLIGLGGRGQYALKEFGVWDDVLRRCTAVLGRKDWAPDSQDGVERIFTQKDKHVTTQVMPRDKLVGALHRHIVDNYGDEVELNYGYEVRPVDFRHRGGTRVLVDVAKCSSDETQRLNPSTVKTRSEEPELEDVSCDVNSMKSVSASLLIAADGTVRTFANAIEEAEARDRASMRNPFRKLRANLTKFRVKRYVDDNQRVYKTIPIQVPSNWRYDLNYSARSKGGRFNFDALPANDRGTYCGVMLLKKGDDMARSDTDPAQLRELLDEYLPAFSPLLDDETVEQVAKKPVSYLPGFRYVGPRLHYGNNCVMLGDCAHTMKPYFGLGANSALEDVKILSDVLDEKSGDIPSAVKEFSKRRAPEARTMVRLSRELDRPGTVGLFTFIFPLILDSIFNRVAPKLFQMNVIAMMQREQYTFRQVARRKRQDRFVQLSIVFGGLYAFVRALVASVRFAATSFGVSTSTVALTAAGTLLAVLVTKRLLSDFMNPSLSPGDVLAKLSKRGKGSNTDAEDESDSDESSGSSAGSSSSSSKKGKESGGFMSEINVTRLVRPRSETKKPVKADATNGETFLTPLGNRRKS